ncbi:MAG: helicase [Candidatus Hydrogenedentota bacterium]|nr:MAG: helicase [Candidatus Hydrogenedentota bacterium]
MGYRPENPLVVQSDRTILLEVNHPRFSEARNLLSAFAEIERSPEHIHTYRLSPLSLWNAAAANHSPQTLLEELARLSKFPIPGNVETEIRNWMERWGKLRLDREGERRLVLHSADARLMKQLRSHKKIRKFLLQDRDSRTSIVDPAFRGHLKMETAAVGWPIQDLAGYREGAAYEFTLREVTSTGRPFRVRDYQRLAAESFYAGGSPEGGAGVIVLPCGAGKTIVGMDIMRRLGRKTLILTTNIVAARQWKSELLDKTSIPENDIKEYSGEKKEIGPVTLATYQIITHRRRKTDSFTHYALFDAEDWGLIIYDEVHLLPAPVFRITAELQSRRRLGLTATLIREDGREREVFSLIGPKKFDVPWRELESSGWIAPVLCREVRVPLEPSIEDAYAVAGDREKFRLASANPQKWPVVQRILEKHSADPTLVIGHYLDQLREAADRFRAPLLTGETPNVERERLYAAFRRGEIPLLVVSRVANFAVDLPDARVAIEISGLFGSRQEEAQRLGRILRPKKDGERAHFYVVVTRNTIEEEFAQKRQIFLVEQGYRYEIEIANTTG